LPAIGLAFIRVADITIIADVDYEWRWVGGSGIGEDMCEVIAYGTGCGYADGRWCEHGHLNVQEQEHAVMMSECRSSGGIVCFSDGDLGIIELHRYHFLFFFLS